MKCRWPLQSKTPDVSASWKGGGFSSRYFYGYSLGAPPVTTHIENITLFKSSEFRLLNCPVSCSMCVTGDGDHCCDVWPNSVLTMLLHKSFQVDFHEYCLSVFCQAPNLRDIKVSRGPQPVSPPDNNTIAKRWVTVRLAPSGFRGPSVCSCYVQGRPHKATPSLLDTFSSFSSSAFVCIS